MDLNNSLHLSNLFNSRPAPRTSSAFVRAQPSEQRYSAGGGTEQSSARPRQTDL